MRELHDVAGHISDNTPMGTMLGRWGWVNGGGGVHLERGADVAVGKVGLQQLPILGVD